MGNLIDLTKYSTMEELKRYTEAQYFALESAASKIKSLEDEVKHLQELLSAMTPSLDDHQVERVIKSPELCIVEAQISLMTQRALSLPLTLEDTKQLDLLIKNKRLLSGESTTIDGAKKPQKKQISDADLIKIARIENKQ